MSSNQDYLRPQKHDKERILPLKNVTYIMPLEEVDNHAENKSNIQQDNQFQSDKPQPS